MNVQHLDVKSAFLNSPIEETIYMRPPPGFDFEENKVCRLRRSIYGLKQSARLWNQTIHNTLISIGFHQSKNDNCLYVMSQKDDLCYLLIHVDDIAITSKNINIINNITKHISSIMEIDNLGEIKTYLGLDITKDKHGTFYINQQTYIKRILNEYGMSDSKTSSIPITTDYDKIKDEKVLIDNNKFQRLIGTLLYVAVNSRPDITAAVCILAQKTSKPTQTDWNELKRVLKYLKGTIHYKLKLFDSAFTDILITWVDANWAENKDDRKSNTGIVIKLYGGVVNWFCRKQGLVTLSSTEAEYVALAEGGQEVIWFLRVLEDLKIKCQYPVKFYEDNQSVLKMLVQEKSSNRTKHIDTKYHFIKDHFKNGTIDCVYCPSEEMIADLLTKPLAASKITYFRKKMQLE
jgi:hypothetical protein